MSADSKSQSPSDKYSVGPSNSFERQEGGELPAKTQAMAAPAASSSTPSPDKDSSPSRASLDTEGLNPSNEHVNGLGGYDDDDDDDDEIDAVVKQAARQEEGANLREMMAVGNSQRLIAQGERKENSPSKKRLSMARWKMAATEVKKEARIVSLIKNIFSPKAWGAPKKKEEAPKPKEKGNKGGWGLVRGIRSIFRFGSIAKEISPLTRATAAAPTQKVSMMYHGTEEEALKQSTAMKKQLKSMKVKTTMRADGVVPLSQQADIAFETPTARMERVQLRKSKDIKDAILQWWIELGFSDRNNKKAAAAATNVLAVNKVASMFKKNLFGKKADGAVSPEPTPATTPKTPASKGKEKEGEGVSKKGGGATVRDVEKGFMTKAEYVKMCVELWRVLSQAEDGITERQAKNSAKKDWKKDSRGLKTMDWSAFYDAIFELADLYTFSVEEADYCRFLKATLGRLPKPLADPKASKTA